MLAECSCSGDLASPNHPCKTCIDILIVKKDHQQPLWHHRPMQSSSSKVCLQDRKKAHEVWGGQVRWAGLIGKNFEPHFVAETYETLYRVCRDFDLQEENAFRQLTLSFPSSALPSVAPGNHHSNYEPANSVLLLWTVTNYINKQISAIFDCLWFGLETFWAHLLCA